MHLSIFLLTFLLKNVFSKYIEGEINTKEDWVFLTRFCFLSHKGLFEYHIEFNEDMGDPNMLLYYDTEDQWPAVYKTQKTCLQKVSAAHEYQYQVINLTATLPNYRTQAGCYYMNEKPSENDKKPNENIKKSSAKIRNITMSTLPPRKTTTTVLVTTEEVPTTSVPTEKDGHFSGSQRDDGYTEETSIYTTWTTEYPSESTTEEWNSQVEVFNSSIMNDQGPMINNRKKRIKRSVPTSRPNTNQRHGRTVVCQNARSFESSRERWWFIVLFNCNNPKGIHLKYKILMTNGAPGDYWHEHLSADEFYILPVLTAFSIAYTILLLGIIVCAIELKGRQLLHTTYKVFFVSVVLQFFGIMLQSIAYLKYSMTGLNISKMKRMGSIFMGASETCFLLLLLLLAKGYTITRGRLPVACSIKLTIFMCTYVVTYITIFIYESVVFDPGEVLYLFESPAGYALIILRILAWCMFIYSIVFTLKHYPEKGNFYHPFNICGTMWFVAGPAFILSGNTYIDKWVRESVVCAVLLFIAFGGHLSFLILTMPSVANKNFPYHVRTTQIGVMEFDPRNGVSTIESFVHHPYEPSGTIGEQTTVIVPLTRRTEEIFEGMYNQRTYSGVKSEREEDPERELQRNNMMENVLSWSLAKNLEAIDYPQFAGSKRESIASTNSKFSNGRTPIDSRSPSQANQNGVPRGYADYIQDVPVELFTISRMVLSTNKSGSRQNTTEEDRENI